MNMIDLDDATSVQIDHDKRRFIVTVDTVGAATAVLCAHELWEHVKSDEEFVHCRDVLQLPIKASTRALKIIREQVSRVVEGEALGSDLRDTPASL
jgi:hypothetical protein